jgi:septal ring factor EnvC (AmiA/AmiB activator)
MSAKPELARFDTRTRRAAQTDEKSKQTNFRAIGAREQSQLALDELDSVNRDDRTDSDTQTTEEPTRGDLEAALGCARTTIDALREQVAQLEAERDQLRQEEEGNQ